MMDYFSDRELGPRPRTEQEISVTVWRALRLLMDRHIEDGSFGFGFPEMCRDGQGPCGCNARDFWTAAEAEIPGVDALRDSRSGHGLDETAPSVLLILDLLEFCARHVARPIIGTFHSYYGHNHLDFDREAGLAEFVAGVNRLFARNGIAYELGSTGRVRRIAPPVLDEALFHTAFSTGDTDTDNLLESARRRFLHQDPIERGVGLEHLWDAFERVKTLGPGKDKKASVKALLDRVAEGSIQGGTRRRRHDAHQDRQRLPHTARRSKEDADRQAGGAGLPLPSHVCMAVARAQEKRPWWPVAPTSRATAEGDGDQG
jgi:hypothetical protein